MGIFDRARRRSQFRVVRGGLSGLGVYTDQQKAAIQSVIATNSAMSALPAATLLAIAGSNGQQSYNPVSNDPALNAALVPANQSLRSSGAPYYFGGRLGFKRDLRSLYVEHMGVMYMEAANYDHVVITDPVATSHLLDYFTSVYGGQLAGYPGWVFEVTGPDNDGSYTYCYIPPPASISQYESYFSGLGGNTQVITSYWGRSSPGPFIQYKDPLLISYDPNYGLVTPASNVIFPVAPDHSLQDILKFITLAVGAYGIATAAAGVLSGTEALTTTAAPVTTQVATQTALTEVQTAGEEALREYEMAQSLGATVTQGEAQAWMSALQNAGLSVPASLTTALQSAPASSTGTTYQAPPQPDISLQNAPTPNASTSSGSTPEATSSASTQPYEAPPAPPSGGSLSPLVKPIASSVLAPLIKAVVGGGNQSTPGAGGSGSYMPGVAIHSAQPYLIPTDKAVLMQGQPVTSGSNFPWWILALVGVIVIVKSKDKGRHHE